MNCDLILLCFKSPAVDWGWCYTLFRNSSEIVSPSPCFCSTWLRKATGCSCKANSYLQ